MGREMDRVQRRIEEKDEILECIDRRLAGENCKSFWDEFSSAGKAGYARIAEIVGMAGDMATNTVKLLAAVVMKNIVIPLVFLMIAVKCSPPMIRYSTRLGSRREARGGRSAKHAEANESGGVKCGSGLVFDSPAMQQPRPVVRLAGCSRW